LTITRSASSIKNEDEDVTSLCNAVKCGNLHLIHDIVMSKVDVNSSKRNGATPLFIAAQVKIHNAGLNPNPIL